MSKDSPEFFPPSGSFRPVVPLSEIDETPGASENTPHASAPHAPLARRVEDGIQARRVGVDEGERRPPEDEEEETLVPSRRGLSTRPPARRAWRRKSRLPSWRFIVPCLVAMLVGGVIADAFWKSVKRPARVDEAASVAEEAAAAEDVETTDAQAPPATEAANPQQAQTVRQDSASEPSAVPETGVAGRARGDVPGAAGTKDARALDAEITSATVVASSARKRTPAEDTAAQPRGRLQSSARDAGNKSAAEARAQRPEAAPRRRAPGTRSPVVTSSSRDQSLPVFSPPASGKSGKKEVIQWP